MADHSLEYRLLRLLELIAEEKQPCKACGTMLYLVRHRNRLLTRYEANGLPHLAVCQGKKMANG